MSDSVCRVSVHSNDGGQSAAADVALPTGIQVGQLIPSIVDIVCGQNDPTPHYWRLSRIGGPALDESMTLAEHGIHDGELLLLSASDPLTPVFGGQCLAVTVAGVTEFGGPPPRAIAASVCLWAAAVAAVTMVWSGVTSTALGRVVTAALPAATVGIAALVAHRTRPDPLLNVVLNVVAVVLAAAVGFLAVPAGPAPANFLLGAAAASSASILLLRVTGCGTVWLTATTTFATTVAAGVASAVVWTLSVAVVGALFATASLVALGVSARLSIWLAGLSPAMPTADDPVDDE